MTSNFRMLALSASLLACGFGVSGHANANAYATSSLNLQKGFVFIGVDTNSDGIPDALNPAISFVSGSVSSVSTSSATLNGVGAVSSSSTPPPDANASNGTGAIPTRTNEMLIGTGPYYQLFGQLATDHSSADAKVVSEQTLTGTPIEARSVAESNIAFAGSADAGARNSSSTAVLATINVNPTCATLTCAVSFSFEADPYLLAVLDAAAGVGSVARSIMSMSITLTKIGDVIPTFSWAPNGASGGIFGGTETADASNLNLTREALLPGQTAEHSAAYAASGFGNFFAYTGSLGTGSYTLSITETTQTDVKRIPEPASVALVGLGLAGLGAIRRRKQV